MVQTLDNITMQARQGSVAAIIQVLNAKLAESGVRTRAVVAQGVLQILCEADSPNKLDQSSLIDQLRTILESVRPRYIRRVKVNTRLVSEQQLLWLEEIERDPDGQLLWTAEFSLSRQSWGQQLQELWHQKQRSTRSSKVVLADTSERERQKRRTWQTLVGLGGLGIFLCLLGWAIYGSLEPRGKGILRQTAGDTASSPVSSSVSSSGADSPNDASESSLTVVSNSQPPASSGTSDANASQTQTPDPFAQAVRLAEQAVADGKSATTVDEWMDLAARWQRASELMGSIPADDERYAIAQDRTGRYRQNSQDSLKQAELAQQAEAE